VCDQTAGTCVQCIAEVEESACAVTGTVCGPDRKCHGCIVDSHCSASSMVCLPSQSCASEASVVYAKPDGSGTACSKAMPCALPEAIAQLMPARPILKLTTLEGSMYGGPAITLDKSFAVQLIGTGTTFTPQAGPPITVTGNSVEILGLTIRGGQGSGIVCTQGGPLTVRRSTVDGSTGYGIETTGCNVTIERSRFSSNSLGGLSLTGGLVEIRNSIIDRNGTNQLDEGNVRLRAVEGRIVFSTLAYNLSRQGGGRTSGITCTAAGAGFVISRNILAQNGPANDKITEGDCIETGNFLADNADDVKFNSATELRLTAASPLAAVLDDPDALAECTRLGSYIDDYQGEIRPVGGFCDKGADEYRP
jgi:hypothetical protein